MPVIADNLTCRDGDVTRLLTGAKGKKKIWFQTQKGAWCRIAGEPPTIVPSPVVTIVQQRRAGNVIRTRGVILQTDKSLN